MHARMRMRKGGPGRAIAGKALARIGVGAAFILMVFALASIGCGNGPAATSGESGIEVSGHLLELAEDVMSYSPRTIREAAHYLRMGIDHPQPPLPGELLSRLQRLEDQELRYVLTECLKSPSFGLELCLTEIIRRGGDEWESVLAAEVDRVYERQGILQDEIARLVAAGRSEESLQSLRKEMRNMRGLMDGGLLTALRRVQGRPDPMVILASGHAERECLPGELPIFEARLTNIDSEGLPMWFLPDCDSRGIRFGKWHVRVVDAEGQAARRIISPSMGGLGYTRRFEFGESWARVIRPSRYVIIDTPGTYTVTLFYHPYVFISDYDFEELEGLILFQSVPIELRIEPVEVKLTDELSQRIDDLISQLPKQSPVRIPGSTYVEGPEGRITPSNTVAELLSIDWPAVPQLIRKAGDAATEPAHRAWILGVLCSITGLNGPGGHELFGYLDSLPIFGPYVYDHSGWRRYRPERSGLAYEQTLPQGYRSAGYADDWAEEEATASSGEGSAVRTKTSVRVDEEQEQRIDPKKQLEFVRERWQPWLDNDWIVVKGE